MSVSTPAQSKRRLALAAGAVLAFLAPAAQAFVVTVTLPTPISVTNNIDGVYLNLVTGAVTATASSGWDFNPYNNGLGLAFFSNIFDDPARAIVANGFVASVLPAGTVIGPASSFSVGNLQTGGGVSGSAFFTTGLGYVGLRFTNESTNATNYGWALLNTTAGNGFPASIVSYAYENTGQSISVPIPEPSTYALTALSLAAVGGLYKRRKTA